MARTKTLPQLSLSARTASRRRGPLSRQAARPRDEGFTLLELLVTLGIVVMLAAVVGPRVLGYFSQAKSQTAQIQLNNVASALELYYLDAGSYPPQEVGLGALMKAPAGAETWNGPYLKKESGLKDPWGRPYRYKFPGEHGDFDVYSYGLDNAEGGSGENADVTSW